MYLGGRRKISPVSIGNLNHADKTYRSWEKTAKIKNFSF